MELRQLKCFVEVSNKQSINQAAKELFLSQSAVSQHIKILEDELGEQLLVRSTHGVVLTEAGRQLLPHALNVIEDIESIRDCIAALHGTLQGTLDVGLTATIEPFVREAILTLMQQHPGLHINIHYKGLTELITMLRNGDIDIMLSIMPQGQHGWMQSESLLSYHLFAVMHNSHPLATRHSLKLTDLERYRIILPEGGDRLRNGIECHLHPNGRVLNVQVVVNDINALMNLLQEGNAVSILAKHSLSLHKTLVAVSVEELMTPIMVWVHHNCNQPLKRSATAFINAVRNSAAFYKSTHISTS